MASESTSAWSGSFFELFSLWVGLFLGSKEWSLQLQACVIVILWPVTERTPFE